MSLKSRNRIAEAVLPDMLGVNVGLVGVGVNVLLVEEKDVRIFWGAMWLVEKDPRLLPRERCEFSRDRLLGLPLHSPGRIHL